MRSILERRQKNFNPLPPHGGRRGQVKNMTIGIIFQSTPSAWRETRVRHVQGRNRCISIHSLRMEGDDTLPYIIDIKNNFNPLPPHGGRRCSKLLTWRLIQDFNPLPPHGGRLYQSANDVCSHLFQSTPSAWRETGKHDRTNLDDYRISIHSLRMEGDMSGNQHLYFEFVFQSTPSAWRETHSHHVKHPVTDSISIHSLRMEGDQVRQRRIQARTHFNPLPPHGGRHTYPRAALSPPEFQSTPSAWRETQGAPYRVRVPETFQSTPSAWRETYKLP